MKKLGLCLLSLCLVGYAVGCAKEEPAPTTPPAEPTTPDAGTTEGGDATTPEGEPAAN